MSNIKLIKEDSTLSTIYYLELQELSLKSDLTNEFEVTKVHLIHKST